MWTWIAFSLSAAQERPGRSVLCQADRSFIGEVGPILAGKRHEMGPDRPEGLIGLKPIGCQEIEGAKPGNRPFCFAESSSPGDGSTEGWGNLKQQIIQTDQGRPIDRNPEASLSMDRLYRGLHLEPSHPGA